jgi:hypothetical protein
VADRIGEIRARADAATKGPWTLERDALGFLYLAGPEKVGIEVDEAQRAADNEFVLHAHSDVSWLLDELEMARGVLAMWELVARREEVTTVQHLAAIRALCHSIRSGPSFLVVQHILDILDGKTDPPKSTKDGA